mmetsp:Transcript_122690/g.291776  ORF Transcript_122690/g.291776 Transcript_122690/m.291776 type:complete len:137 (-) Transcript_122690:372-782(-)
MAPCAGKPPLKNKRVEAALRALPRQASYGCACCFDRFPASMPQIKATKPQALSLEFVHYYSSLSGADLFTPRGTGGGRWWYEIFSPLAACSAKRRRCWGTSFEGFGGLKPSSAKQAWFSGGISLMHPGPRLNRTTA